MNIIKFDKTRCRVLHVNHNSPCYQDRLGEEVIESNLEQKDLGALVGEKLDVRQLARRLIAAWACPHIKVAESVLTVLW